MVRIVAALFLSVMGLFGVFFIAGVFSGDITIKNITNKNVADGKDTNKFKIGDIVKPTYSDKKGCIVRVVNGLYFVHIDGFYNKYAYAEFKEFEIELAK